MPSRTMLSFLLKKGSTSVAIKYSLKVIWQTESSMRGHFIWNLWNSPKAHFINFIWNDHSCKILYVSAKAKMGIQLAKLTRAYYIIGSIHQLVTGMKLQDMDYDNIMLSVEKVFNFYSHKHSLKVMWQTESYMSGLFHKFHKKWPLM